MFVQKCMCKQCTSVEYKGDTQCVQHIAQECECFCGVRVWCFCRYFILLLTNIYYSFILRMNHFVGVCFLSKYPIMLQLLVSSLCHLFRNFCVFCLRKMIIRTVTQQDVTNSSYGGKSKCLHQTTWQRQYCSTFIWIQLWP